MIGNNALRVDVGKEYGKPSPRCVSFTFQAMITPLAHAALVYSVLSCASFPLIDEGMPGTQDNRYGLEGGRVVKVEGRYHLITAERSGDPIIVKMRLAHWASVDGASWQRVDTLYESSGDRTGNDPRAALWGPMPVYDETAAEWNLFYVGYRSKPNTSEGWFDNYEGRIWRAISKTPGAQGISGPYQDVGVIMQPDGESQAWEGLQGVDSFFPYRGADGMWRGFYGSAQTQHLPCTFWGAGLASAPSLSGPWHRCPTGNPVRLDALFAENPIVDRVGELWVAMMDGGERGQFGYATSSDGVVWSQANWIDLTGVCHPWWRLMRTPLGLIRENDGTYTVFFTAFKKLKPGEKDFACLGRARIRLDARP